MRRHHSPPIEMLDPDPIEDPDSGLRLGAGKQDGFEIDLVDPMWRFGCRPIGVWPFGRRVTVRATRDRDARQLASDDGRAICAVIGEVGRQPPPAPAARCPNGGTPPSSAPRRGSHFTLGGSPAPRISATTTSMPRDARSMAAVNPTGPAPTMRTWVSIFLMTISLACRSGVLGR